MNRLADAIPASSSENRISVSCSTVRPAAAGEAKGLYAVVFEVQPDPSRHDDYLRLARGLRADLEAMPGFVENERFSSRTRPGVLLSLSLWTDEKALVRWRSAEAHHAAQAEGRGGVLLDYHLRVGEAVASVGAPEAGPGDGRRDQTETGQAKALAVVEWTGPGAAASGAVSSSRAQPLSREWFDHLSTPGRALELTAWRDESQARAYLAQEEPALAGHGRGWVVRVLRDYGLRDRREAPQFFPAPARAP